MRAAALVVFIVASMVLAGCAGGEAPPLDTSAAPSPTDTTGSISGMVHDVELIPVGGVEVALVQANVQTTTNESGGFVFNDLAAGSYSLVAQKLGFDSIARSVVVEAGEVSQVELELAPLEITEDPFFLTLPFEGYIHCGVNPYWPTNLCGDTLGEDNARFVFPIERVDGFTEVVAELVWTPSTAATGQYLEMDICEERPASEDQLLCYETDYWHYESGTSPVVMRHDDVPVDEHQSFMIGVGAGYPLGGSPDPLKFMPAVQQQFSLYVSLCYVEECAEAFSALPPE